MYLKNIKIKHIYRRPVNINALAVVTNAKVSYIGIYNYME